MRGLVSKTCSTVPDRMSDFENWLENETEVSFFDRELYDQFKVNKGEVRRPLFA